MAGEVRWSCSPDRGAKNWREHHTDVTRGDYQTSARAAFFSFSESFNSKDVDDVDTDDKTANLSIMASTFRTTGRKIVAIGRNYADHAKELNNKVPTEPFFFLKPTTSYLDNGGTIEIPRGVAAHFEGE